MIKVDTSGGGLGPGGGTTVAVCPDIWIPVAIALTRAVGRRSVNTRKLITGKTEIGEGLHESACEWGVGGSSLET